MCGIILIKQKQSKQMVKTVRTIGMISRRLMLMSACATIVCLTSCTSPSERRAAYKEAKEKKMNTVPTISWEDHLKAAEGHGLWLGVEEYIVYPDIEGKCLRPRLYAWNHRINKYVIRRWVLDHEYKVN